MGLLRAEKSLLKKGLLMCDRVPSLFTVNYHNIVCQWALPQYKIKCFFLKRAGGRGWGNLQVCTYSLGRLRVSVKPNRDEPDAFK